MPHDQALRDGLLAVMRHSAEPMVLSDPNLPDMPVVAANEAFRRLTGYEDADILGRNCRFLQGPDADPATVQRIGDCLRAGQGCVQWLINRRRDGRPFWNLLFISPVFGEGGRVLYFFANQHDLSGEASLGLDQFTLGPAHMPAPQQSEFHALLEAMGQSPGHGSEEADATQARALEAVLAGTRQVAFWSTRLAEGPGLSGGG